MIVKCFFLKETDLVRRSLRRFASNSKCPGKAYHNRMVQLDAVHLPAGETISEPNDFPRDHWLWPSHCECGYAFTEQDTWQVFPERLYERSDTGAYITLLDAEPGAMWYADWMIHEGSRYFVGPDGHCLVVKLPDCCDWVVDGPSTNGNGWTRSGEVPNVTANPSIQTENYHGWLRNGELISC